jgi:membrane-associated protease RseP (regulator of RpoE activity)
VRISGTVPNTGAAKAGLQADDIITQIDDTDITGFAAFAPAVAGKNVGAEMGVVFYRDNHKHTVTMPLSPRPAPNVPDNPADFADQVQQLYAQLDAQLDELLASVSDEEASISPTEGEWSVKEILCHLIASERGTQFGIAVQLGGQALTVFPNNPAAPTAALLAVYPTLAELVHVWKQTEAETVALVKNLPPEYAARKVDYLNNGLTLLLGNPGHTQSHFREMQRALETVRSR